LLPDGKLFQNSVGMQMVRIEPGTFEMGIGKTPLPPKVAPRPQFLQGDFDERPTHRVRISKPFLMGTCQVTNIQFEKYEPGHRKMRGKLNFSKDDDEAVVFVDWHEASGFLSWLSEREGLNYRLPTEAEWEYACRAGTTTHYHTGDTLPDAYLKNPRMSWYPDPERSKPTDVVPLHVGVTPPNQWGLHDMHGNVEEWCLDWYGPYTGGGQVDPVGYADGDFRVTRAGGHSTEVYYLRSSNRMGTLPEARSWLVGFRVVLGEDPAGNPLPPPPTGLNCRCVKQEKPSCAREGYDSKVPYFEGPRVYVKVPAGSNGPMFSEHNHDPALTACPNGDLLAIWYSCWEEAGREVCLLASRLRRGETEWDPASPFWDAPDRDDHAPALWFDGKNRIYQFVGLSAAATWGNTATVMRTSDDSGATWSRARIINPEHGTRHMPVESVFMTMEGFIVLPCDAVSGGRGGTAIHISGDGGRTWEDPGGKAAGIHAGIAQMGDGRLLALGRGDDIDGMMPMSVSSDMGRSWAYTASGFQPISSGQRLVLLRLKEGPLFFASFARGMPIEDRSGTSRNVSGLYGAISYDDGVTWPFRRLISDDGPGREVTMTDGIPFTLSASNAEPGGYLSVCQDSDGVINLISSRNHYSFNLAWLRERPPAPPGPE